MTDTDECRLHDITSVIEVGTGAGLVPADVGEAVTIEGFVDDDMGPREFYADTMTLDDSGGRYRGDT